MGFLKDLIFVNKDEQKVESTNIVDSSKTKFPKVDVETSPFNTGNPVISTPTVDATPHITKAIETYQSGFDSLNQAGYDFYEYYQMVAQGGVSNPQSYVMAFSMGAVMDKTITKDKLLQQSDFYLGEIAKVYNTYVIQGTKKREELITQKKLETESLTNQLDLMKQELDALKTKIQNSEYKLNGIEGVYSPKINEIDSKLAANNIAKDTIVKSIEQVKQGIITNLK